MGNANSASIKYSVPIGEKKEGESQIYRKNGNAQELFTLKTTRTIQAIHTRNFENAADKPALGYRPVKDGKCEERFEWYTYKQVGEKVKAIGSGILNKNLAPEVNEFKDYKLRMVSLYSKNNVPMWLVDMACSCFKITLVSIYDTLGESATRFVFNDTNVTSCFLTCDKIKNITEMMKKEPLGKLETLVILDPENMGEDAKMLEGYNWTTLPKIMESGKAEPQEYPEVKPEDIYCFSYTSGTTGNPKGVMLTQENVVSCSISAAQTTTLPEYSYLSYLPLPHVYEKALIMLICYRAGKIGMFNGNVLDLKTDLRLLKPTIFASVPRLLNKFYDKMMEGINKLTGVKKSLIQKGIKAKLKKLRTSGGVKHGIYDNFFTKFRDILGGRVQIMVSGSAPLSVEVQEMFMILMSAPLLNGYGQTEGMGAEFLTSPGDSTVGIVGAPMSCLEFKLLDIPDMNYLSTDLDEQGKPSPRGEILVRGPMIFPEYYKQEEKTKETKDEDGWLHSGDVGQILPGSNALKIIDRRKNMFKLSQGEYIAPEKLEIGYKNVEGIEDIFVYGDSLKSALVAILNVDLKQLEKIASEKKIEGNIDEWVKNEDIKTHYISLMNDQAKKLKFSGLEKIKKIYIEKTPFADFDLVTTTFKLKRHEAKKHYQEVLDELYKTLD